MEKTEKDEVSALIQKYGNVETAMLAILLRIEKHVRKKPN